MKTLLLSGIAALFLATGAAHARNIPPPDYSKCTGICDPKLFRCIYYYLRRHSQAYPAAALALPAVAGPVWRALKWIRSAPAALRPYRRPALIERRIAAVLAAVPRVDRTPTSAGPRRLTAARPALGVSVGEQQSHYCDTEQNKTNRPHDL